MKTIDTVQMSDHLDQQVTGLVTCWIIEREDGLVYRFTDATEDLSVDGDTYSAVGAYKRSAIESTSTLSVDNLEVVGISGDLSLPEQDLRNGLFDNARISVFMAAWSTLVPGKIRLRRGFFGEVQSLPNGTFQVELRGLMQRLSYNYLDMFSPTCLYDLGEPACGVVIRPDQVQRSTAYSVGDVVIAAQSSAATLGKRYPLTVVDNSFETLSSTGFTTSLAWFDVGANPMVTTSATSVSGSNSLSAGAGAGATQQVIELETSTEMDFATVEAGEALMSLSGYWRSDGADARYQVRFYDEDYKIIETTRSVSPTQRFRTTSPFSIAGEFTVACWVKTTGTGTYGIMAGGTEVLADTGFDIYVSGESVFVRANPGFVDQDIVTFDPVTSLKKISPNEWHHIAVTRDAAGNVNLYVDFELLGTSDFLWTGPFYFEDLFADNDEESALNIFSGEMDDFRIYNVQKSQSDIIKEATNPPTLPDANLLRWFSFDDDTLNDQSGNDVAVYGAGTGTTYQTATAPINGDSGTIAGVDSGNVTVGTTYVPFESTPFVVPSNAKQAIITLSCTGPDVTFDAISATLFDSQEVDEVFLPSLSNNVYWECTSGGTTAATYPATYAGGDGSTAADGSVTFTARNAYLRGGKVVTGTDRRSFTSIVADARGVDGWFNGGSVIFVTGDNAGVVMEVKDWRNTDGAIDLFLSVPGNINTNDEFYIYPGCDKSRISCAAIFNNIANFFGFPDVPGQDELLRYPDSKQ